MSLDKIAEMGRNAFWEERVAEVRAFAHSHNRWPSTVSEDEDEKRLAQWWSRQKNYYNAYKKKNKNKNLRATGMCEHRAEAMRSLLDAFPNFDRDVKWMNLYNKVKRRIDKHGKLWPYNTQDKSEQKALRWWNQQKTFCRKFLDDEIKGGMTKRRFDLVQSLLERMGHPPIAKVENKNFKEILGFDEPEA